jgi:hypothetical protein
LNICAPGSPTSNGSRRPQPKKRTIRVSTTEITIDVTIGK